VPQAQVRHTHSDCERQAHQSESQRGALDAAAAVGSHALSTIGEGGGAGGNGVTGTDLFADVLQFPVAASAVCGAAGEGSGETERRSLKRQPQRRQRRLRVPHLV